MTASREELWALLDLVGKTADVEIDCDDVLERVAACLEHVETGESPEGFADLRQHLGVCPECLEEFEALVDAYTRRRREST